MERRAEAVHESRVVETQQPAARAGEAPQKVAGEPPQQQQHQQQQQPPLPALSPQDAVNLLTKPVKSTLEDLERAFKARDISSLADIFRRMGIDTVEIQLYGAVNKIPVEKLSEYLNSLGRYEREQVLEQLRIRYGQQDPAELAARIAPSVFKSFGIDAKVESTPAAHVIKLGDVEVVINRITKEIGARFTDQYVSRLNSELLRRVEAGDVEGVLAHLRQLPEGVREKLGGYYTAWAEFYRKYGAEINALAKQLEKADKPGEILEKLNSLLEKASAEYNQLLQRGVPSHMYSVYDEIRNAVNKLKEQYARQLEVYRYIKQVSEAGGGIEGLAKLASLTPPGGAPSTFKIDDKTSVQITGTGYAIVKFGDKPLFAVDKSGRVFAVDKDGGVTNMGIKPDYAGLALYLARKGLDAREAVSIASAASVFGAEAVLGDLYNVARRLGERLELGNVIISPNSITVNGKEFKVVDVRGGRPIVSTEYGPATLEAALQLEAVKEAAKKAVSLDPTKSFSPTANIPQIEITPIKTSGVVTGFHVAPITKFELALPRLVDIGGVAVPYATEEGLDKSHKFTVAVKPTPDGMYKVRIVGEGIDKEGVVKDVNAFIRSTIAEFYTAKYGAPAHDFIVALKNPEKAQASVDLKEYAQWLRDALAGKVAAMATPQHSAFLYGVAKGFGLTDTIRTIFLNIPASIAGIFSSDVSKQLISLNRFWETYEQELSRIRRQEFGTGTAAGLGALTVASLLAAVPSGGATLAALGARGAATGARAAIGATTLSKVLTAAEFASATATGVAASVGAVQTALATARGYDPLTVANDYLNVVSTTSLLGLVAGGAKWALLRVKPEALDSLAKLYKEANEAILRTIDQTPDLRVSFAKAFGAPLDVDIKPYVSNAIRAADKLVRDPKLVTDSELDALVQFAEGARRLGRELGLPENSLPDPSKIAKSPESLSEFYKALEITINHGIYNALKRELYVIAERDPQKFMQLYEKYRESIEAVAKNIAPSDVYVRVRDALIQMGADASTADRLARQAQWGWSVGQAIVNRAFQDVFESLPPAIRGRLTEAAVRRYPELRPLREVERIDVETATRLLAERLGSEELARQVAQYLKNPQFIGAYREYYAGVSELDAVLKRLADVLFPRADRSALKSLLAELRARNVKPEELEEIAKKATVKETVPETAPLPEETSALAVLLVRRPFSEVVRDLAETLKDSERLVKIYKVPEPLAERLVSLANSVRERIAELWLRASLGYAKARGALTRLLRERGFNEEEIKTVEQTLQTIAKEKTESEVAAGRPGTGEAVPVATFARAPAVLTRARTEEVATETAGRGRAIAAVRVPEERIAREKPPVPIVRPAVIRPAGEEIPKQFRVGPFIFAPVGEARLPIWAYSLGLPISVPYFAVDVASQFGKLRIYVPAPEYRVQIGDRVLVETPEGRLYLATPQNLYEVTVTTAPQTGAVPELPRVGVRPIPPGGGYPSWWVPLSRYFYDIMRALYQRERLKI